MLDALLNAYAALWRVDTLGVAPAQPKPSASSSVAVAPSSSAPSGASCAMRKKLPSVQRLSIDDRLRALMGPMISEEELTSKLAFGRLLGSGATSKVFAATDAATGREVSVKVFDKASMIEVRRSMAADGSSATEEKAVHRVRRRLLKILSEMEISKSLDHPNIIKYLGAYETPYRLCIVHELVEGTDLLEHLLAHGKMDEDTAASVFSQLLSAVQYCHDRNVYHRDLKLENVLITADMTVKLIDFGLSEVVYPGEMLYTMCGTPLYCSPEILFLHTKRRSPSPSARGFDGGPADVWSIGVLIFALLTGCAPFDDSSFHTLRHEVARRSIAYPSHLSDEVKGLLKSMLVFDAHMRPTIKDLLDYEWFQRERALTSATDDSTNVALSRTMIEHLEEITTDSEILSESISDLDEDEMDVMDELGVEVKKHHRSLSYRSNGSRTEGTSSSSSSLEDSHGKSEADPATSAVAPGMSC